MPSPGVATVRAPPSDAFHVTSLGSSVEEVSPANGAPGRGAQGRGGRGLVFGRTLAKPFSPNVILRHSQKAWKAAELEPIGLHGCRHTFASLMIAAGVNAKALSELMGHSSITVTFDRYGHLMRWSRDEAARLLESYLASVTALGTG